VALKMIVTIRILMVLLAVPALGQSIGIRPPHAVTAGNSFSVTTGGSGSATFYLLGPSHVVKKTIQLGQDLPISGSDVANSGLYQLIVCDSSGCSSADLYALPSSPERLTFLVHPSRVPVSAANAINATALVSDRFRNTVVAPVTVMFHFSSADAGPYSHGVPTSRGIAWLEIGSTSKQGPLQIGASVAEASETRVIQQVASEACGIRMQATSEARRVRLRTDPVRDCSGNALPDGTIVSFTKIDDAGRSTVDTPLKKSVANAQFTLSGRARISVACGVALGNEVSIGGQP
jgi:hypothetical protein